MFYKVIIFIVLNLLLVFSYSYLRNSIILEKLEISSNIVNVKKDIDGLNYLANEPVLTDNLIGKYDDEHGTNLSKQLKKYFSFSDKILSLEQKEILKTMIKEKKDNLIRVENKSFLDKIPTIPALIFALLSIMSTRVIVRFTDYCLDNYIKLKNIFFISKCLVHYFASKMFSFFK